MDRGTLDVVSLGLYHSEVQARNAVLAFKRRGPSVAKYTAILADLVATGVVPPTLLPKWVYRIPWGGEVRYAAWRWTWAGEINLPGPYDTPEAAFRAMLAVVAVTRPG